MEDEECEEDAPFEGVDIDSPFGHIRMGRGRGGKDPLEPNSADEAYESARHRVRRRLRFYRNLTGYVILNLILVAFDGLTGGGFWVQWVAGVLGAFLLWDFLQAFVFPNLWGREAERRMIEREMKRRGERSEDR